MGKARFLYKNVKNSFNKSISVSTGITISKPLQVSIQPNERCNARCVMCDCWKEKTDYLTSEMIIEALKQLRQLNKGDFFVQIAGGEPLIFKGIYDIFSYCSQNNIICKTSTNGIALTEKNCDKIIESGLSYLSVSLDSHLPEIHDKYRGVENTLEKATNGLKYLAANGKLTLGISSVLMKDNISTFDKSVDYFLSLPIHRLLIQPIRIWTENLPINRWKEYKYWVDDLESLKRVIDYILAKKKEDSRILNTEKDIHEWYQYFTSPESFEINKVKKCKIGFDRVGITYKGDLSLGCDHFNYVGNIKDEKIKDLWYSPKAKKIRNQMLNCKYPCTSNCYKELTFSEKISKAKVLIKSGLFDKK